MIKEFNAVMVGIDRYSQLVATAARVDSLKRIVSKSEYSISREDIASILGFELPADKKDE